MSDEGGAIPSSGPAEIVTTAEAFSITSSRAEGTQTATLELRRHEHKVYLDTKKLEEQQAQKAHERKKDWVLFCVVVSAIIGSLVLAVALIFFGPDDESRRRGESLLFLVIGALVGYVTGSKTAQ